MLALMQVQTDGHARQLSADERTSLIRAMALRTMNWPAYYAVNREKYQAFLEDLLGKWLDSLPMTQRYGLAWADSKPHAMPVIE